MKNQIDDQGSAYYHHIFSKHPCDSHIQKGNGEVDDLVNLGHHIDGLRFWDDVEQIQPSTKMMVEHEHRN